MHHGRFQAQGLKTLFLKSTSRRCYLPPVRSPRTTCAMWEEEQQKITRTLHNHKTTCARRGSTPCAMSTKFESELPIDNECYFLVLEVLDGLKTLYIMYNISYRIFTIYMTLGREGKPFTFLFDSHTLYLELFSIKNYFFMFLVSSS